MALDLLGIPATSTPSERCFSRAGEIFSSRRKHMRGDIAQALLNLGSWWGTQSLSGHDAPILNHPAIYHSRQTALKLPVLALNDAKEIIIKVEKEWEEEDIDTTLEKMGCSNEVSIAD